ncbi:DNA-binding transcriptional LysR family regulator [Sinobaca qinghaiensis]|uniref:DNA-binding transcriptional LysR family regulator n=1 Tax=Sinobaca qinghaiensis TaxID=342944 RepID=A0A419V4V6_9BACL|nr:LysR family transcriptional regulator [Sinobaca qinghaiensis]RKD73471.1 DNA-binding transcriptional LysR family regulator [Sinobaca qinghaiensis]
MDIQHLKYFSEVARQLNFTKASAALHISQPSLSKAIKHIEEEIGVPLFYRYSKKLELTDAGKAVLVNAKKVLESFDNMNEELSDIIELKKGEIRIGIPPIIGAAFFSQLVSRYKEAHPSIELLLTEVGTKSIKQGVDEGTLDIGLICNLPVEQQNFEMEKLLKDPLMLIVPAGHKFDGRSSVAVDELAEERFILYRNDFSLYDRIIEECEQHSFSPNIVCESSQKDFMVDMVEATLGVALLPSRICRDIHQKQITAIPLHDSSLHLELGMIWKRDKYLAFAVREFISMSQEHLLHST